MMFLTKVDKFIIKLLSGNSDHNIEFEVLIQLLIKLNFESRVKGSHHIFWKAGIEEIINLQSNGRKAKPYHVKQVRKYFN